MAFTQTLDQTVNIGSRSVVENKTYTGTGQASVSESIADSTTDGLVNIAIDVSEIKIIIMSSDQDLTVKTNSSGAPDETISLVAGVPLIWTSDSYYVNLLATDITKLYVTNASGSAAEFKVEVLVDATP